MVENICKRFRLITCSTASVIVERLIFSRTLGASNKTFELSIKDVAVSRDNMLR